MAWVAMPLDPVVDMVDYGSACQMQIWKAKVYQELTWSQHHLVQQSLHSRQSQCTDYSKARVGVRAHTSP